MTFLREDKGLSPKVIEIYISSIQSTFMVMGAVFPPASHKQIKLTVKGFERNASQKAGGTSHYTSNVGQPGRLGFNPQEQAPPLGGGDVYFMSVLWLAGFHNCVCITRGYTSSAR